jgi:hypothetical protein
VSFWRDKQTLRLTLVLFGVFLFLFFSITYISHRKFSPGEGLAESVSHEALVQFVVRATSNDVLGVTAETAEPAMRASFGAVLSEKLLLKNTNTIKKSVQFHVVVQPQEIADALEWVTVWPLQVDLAPGEEKVLLLKFRVNQEKFKTSDGVLAVKLFY